MTSSHPMPAPCQWFSRLAIALDCRSAPRLALLLLGAASQVNALVDVALTLALLAAFASAAFVKASERNRPEESAKA